MNDFDGISVLMAVYFNDNSEYFDLAIASTLNSVEKFNFQLVIVKDGPLKKEHLDIILKYKEKYLEKITLVDLKVNLGLAKALNAGLAYCQYKYVARMDADDLCEPDRFFHQVDFIKKNPDVDVFGGWVCEYNEAMDSKLGIRRVPIKRVDIERYAKRRSPINHPTVIFKKESVIRVGGYPEYRKSQDYALWSLMINEGFVFGNIDHVLVKMRAGASMSTRRGLSYFSFEKEIFKFQKKIGFINSYYFYTNIVIRFLLRSSPKFLITFFYRLRVKNK